MDRETGNQGTTTPEPHKISHKSSYRSQQLDMSSCYHIVRPQGFMAAQRSCFIKQGRPAVAFHTIVRRRTRCIPTSDQALCPVGIFRGKAASKADSAPPMSHSSRALLGMYCLVQGQGCRVLRLPLTAQNSAIKRCPQCRRPCIIWQHVTFCSRYTFLMVSNPDRIAPGRRLPESTQSILHHYFIRSHADTSTYLLIINKFLSIRYQTTVK